MDKLTNDNITEIEELLALASAGDFQSGTHFSPTHEAATAWFRGCLDHNPISDVHLVTTLNDKGVQVVAVTGNGQLAQRNAFLIALLLKHGPTLIAELKERREQPLGVGNSDPHK